MSTQAFLSTDPAFQLASALQAIDEAIKDFAEVKIEHKVRMERLYKEAGRLRMEILTGQKQLPLEGEPLDVKGGEDIATKIANAAAEIVNSGALDLPDCKVTMTVNPDV
jgi:hypothetical protein